MSRWSAELERLGAEIGAPSSRWWALVVLLEIAAALWMTFVVVSNL